MKQLAHKLVSLVKSLLLDWRWFWLLVSLLLVGETGLLALIVQYIPYTEIDWVAYMQEVRGFLEGERDYAKLRGDTGPLVYPAGFVYVFSGLYYWTEHGRNLLMAQVVFAVLYLATLAVVFQVYRAAARVSYHGDLLGGYSYLFSFLCNVTNNLQTPPYALVLLCLSKRFHSIYVLRLFNDPAAMFFLYISVWALQRYRYALATLMFSLALSVKMNILLFLPAYGVILWYNLGTVSTTLHVATMLLIQIVLGLPFLLHHSWNYVSLAFDLSRAFLYKWSVNWKMLPESVFLDKRFASLLLIGMLATLVSFFHYRFLRSSGGLVSFVRSQYPLARKLASPRKPLSPEFITTVMFTTQFIGIVFSRSLHYQFYSWYFLTLPYLLWAAFPSWKWPVPQVVLFAAIECCWNVYPATVISSSILLSCHLLILSQLWRNLDARSALLSSSSTSSSPKKKRK